MPNDDVLRFLAEQIAIRRTASGRREGGQKELIPLIQGKFPNYASKPLNASTIGRWEKDLWDRGVLVEWIDYNALWRGELLHGDSNELASSFDLKESLVVGLDQEVRKSEAHTLYALANEAADDIRTQNVLRNYRHLALGSGRALIRFSESLMNRPTSARNLAISPVSGRLWVGDLWSLQDPSTSLSELESPLDADFSALFVARGLHHAQNPDIRLSQISRVAYTGSKEERDEVANSRCPFVPKRGWNWQLPSPNRIVVGGAPLDDEKHPLNRFVKTSDGVAPKVVDASLAKKVEKMLKSIIKEDVPTKLPPPAEVSLRIFPCAPLPSEWNRFDANQEVYKATKQSIDALNQRTLSLSFQHFRDVVANGGISQIIAGGRSKQRLLWTLLLPNILSSDVAPLFNAVCTDSETALLLRQSKEMLESDRNLYRNYESIAETIFSET